MKKIIFICILCMLFTCFLEADYYIKAEVDFGLDTQEELENYEEQPTIIEIWVGDNYILANFDFSGAEPFPLYHYIDLSEKKQYFVRLSEKAYSESPSIHEEPDKELTEEKIRELEEEYEKLKGKISVTPIKEKRKIGEWLCKGYRVEYKQDEAITSITETWVTKDVPFDWRLLEQIEERFASEKMLQAADVINSMYNYPEIEGFEIEKISKVIKNGKETHCTITTVVEISEKGPPAALLSFPKGFKKVEDLTDESEIFQF